jgi:hypothetical protein
MLLTAGSSTNFISSGAAINTATTNTATWTAYNLDGSVRNDETGDIDSATVNIIPPSTPIPTLSEWGMIIMSLLLAGSAVWMIRRRQYGMMVITI